MPTKSIVLRGPTDADSAAVARLLTELGHRAAADDTPARLAALEREGGTAVLAEGMDRETLGFTACGRRSRR